MKHIHSKKGAEGEFVVLAHHKKKMCWASFSLIENRLIQHRTLNPSPNVTCKRFFLEMKKGHSMPESIIKIPWASFIKNFSIYCQSDKHTATAKRGLKNFFFLVWMLWFLVVIFYFFSPHLSVCDFFHPSLCVCIWL